MEKLPSGEGLQERMLKSKADPLQAPCCLVWSSWELEQEREEAAPGPGFSRNWPEDTLLPRV